MACLARARLEASVVLSIEVVNIRGLDQRHRNVGWQDRRGICYRPELGPVEADGGCDGDGKLVGTMGIVDTDAGSRMPWYSR